MNFKTGSYTSDQLPLSVYHGGECPAVSKTELDRINQSYAHYLEGKNSKGIEGVSKPLVEGGALHCLALTPELFQSEYRILPGGLNRRTREGRALYDSIVAAGKPVITSLTFTRLEAMAGAILNHPSASQLLQGGVPETSYIWTDPGTGVLCKCRPDYMTGLVISDIKTCVDASYEAFQRHIIEYRYHVQGAYFVDGTYAVTKQKRDFVLIAVEKTAPFAVAAYKLDEDTLELGRAEYRKNLQTYNLYQKNPDKWPGYDSGVQTMTLPRWAKRNGAEVKSVSAGVLI